MTTRTTAPAGAPCWTDLMTSDVEGSRRFYGEVFGWEAGEPSPEFGGYFMFMRDGVPVAGAMGPMEGVPASNFWQVYLATDDLERTLKAAEAEGGQVVAPAMPVADLGIQGRLLDPAGGLIGVWQPGTFQGFSVLEEPRAPSWFELHTRDHARVVAFYKSVFGIETIVAGDTDEFRYTVLAGPGGEQLAGVMDATSWLPEGTAPQWSVYWEVADVDATAAKAVALGGQLLMEAEDTPYGRLGSLSDPSGAAFKLRTSPG